MAVRHMHARAWINFPFRVAVLGFATTTYLLGAVTLSFGTLLTALYLTYRWFRDGVWYSYTLADVLVRHSAPGRPAQSEGWLLEAPLLIALPVAGAFLTVAGMAIVFSLNYFIVRGEEADSPGHRKTVSRE